MRALVPLGFLAPCVVIYACSSDDSGGTASNQGGSSGTGATGTGGKGGTSGAGGTGGGGGLTLDGSSDVAADACVADKVVAKLDKKPVDVIVVVDTSATMDPASSAVESNINANLAAVLTGGNVDYRVIVIAGYGGGTELCVGPPLGGASCSPPPATPASTATFFHYPSATGSGAFLANIVNWYKAPDSLGVAPGGWSTWLRAEALKVFVALTDSSSSSSLSGAQFDAQLLALTPAMFGTAGARNYVFHSIIGLAENNPATSAWLPSDPVVNGTCSGYSGALGAGQPWQDVSILTGGLRFPICQFGSFDVVFKAIASSVVQSVPIACDIPFPTAPAGKSIDPNTIQLDYTPGGGGSPEQLTQVKDASACGPSSFWVEGQTIHLCPAACSKVNATPGGSVDVRFGCDVGFVK